MPPHVLGNPDCEKATEETAEDESDVAEKKTLQGFSFSARTAAAAQFCSDCWGRV
jgi:hypothetical protein